MQRNTQSIQFCKSHVATMLWKTGWRQLSASPMKVLPRRRAWVWHSPLSILIRVSNGKNLPTHQSNQDVRRIAPLPKVVLEDARFTVYENEREVIATYVSTYGLQKHSNKGKPWQALKFQPCFSRHRHSLCSANQCDLTCGTLTPVEGMLGRTFKQLGTSL